MMCAARLLGERVVMRVMGHLHLEHRSSITTFGFEALFSLL
jgi:hypothetical protein